MNTASKDLKTLLKKVIEILMPNLDHYRRPLRKGRVIATYPSSGRYVCDVEILLNNEQPDTAEPILKGVEIPVIWGGKNRGIICPPSVGVMCDVDYYHGDPNYPRISNFRWQGQGAPSSAVDELIIQQKGGVYVRIKANSDVEVKTPEKVIIDAPATDIKGTLTVDGLITYKAGLLGSGGGEVSAKISGKVQAAEIVSDNGISLNSHTHPGVESGNKSTGEPQ